MNCFLSNLVTTDLFNKERPMHFRLIEKSVLRFLTLLLGPLVHFILFLGDALLGFPLKTFGSFEGSAFRYVQSCTLIFFFFFSENYSKE
jgi:hypothetical protein